MRVRERVQAALSRNQVVVLPLQRWNDSMVGLLVAMATSDGWTIKEAMYMYMYKWKVIYGDNV